MRYLVPCWVYALIALATPSAVTLGADLPSRSADQEGGESIVGTDGERIPGRIQGDPAKGFLFVSDQGGAVPLATVGEVRNDGQGQAGDPAEAVPPFQVLLGLGQRISGRLGEVGPSVIRLDDGPAREPISINRTGTLALIQRPGEAQVFRDDFETLALARWTLTGEPELTAESRLSGRLGLFLPAGGASVTHRLVEPVASGTLEIAFRDDAARVARQRWFVDLTFRDGDLLQSIRAVPGWQEETLAVESPRGPTLNVQRLVRRPGWHRLVVRFGPGRTDLAVDGDELAHGEGVAGPLVEVRLATEPVGNAEAPDALAAHLDDLRISRLAEPAGPPEVDPSQDSIRLITGDQLFGRIQGANADRVALEIDGKRHEFGWSDVAGLRFRREPSPSPMVEGLLVRADWRPGPGGDVHDLDRLEGVLTGVNVDQIILTTPYAGTVKIPRARLRRLQVLGTTRRVMLSPFSYHLGSRVDDDLDPPQPEGGTLAIDFTLDRLIPGPAALVLDVVKVVGESGNLDFSAEVKEGFLRTHVQINGQQVGDLNRQIHSSNEVPERIKVPIPAGVLTIGVNHLRFTQTGMKADPEKLDNLGLLGIALEMEPGPAVGGEQP
ncbi:MAG: hypothetical protein ABI353_01265 [Isosphaeraceae bacterium]